jgi:alanine racemase
MARPNQARLNLTALRHNLGLVRELAPGTGLMAVVKANAYGHGSVIIARALAPLADALAVASIEEAIALREAGIGKPILLLQGVFEAAELELAAELDLWVSICSEQQLCWLEESRLRRPLGCWLKIDTGMHRLGIPHEDTATCYRRLEDCPQARADTVLCTHFASADEPTSGQTFAQIERFERACSPLPAPRSACNSAGVMAWPAAHYQWVRPGYMLYGNSPFAGPQQHADRLRPVMTLVSAVTALRHVAPGETVGYGASWTASRPSHIATVTIGYGDGYPRLAPTGTPVLVNGQRATLAGRVSMDMLTVDVTELPGVRIDDEVVLWGEGLPVGEVARHVGTIGYELTTRMPARTPRVVVEH